jgi:hypothetical protein
VRDSDSASIVTDFIHNHVVINELGYFNACTVIMKVKFPVLN